MTETKFSTVQYWYGNLIFDVESIMLEQMKGLRNTILVECFIGRLKDMKYEEESTLQRY